MENGSHSASVFSFTYRWGLAPVIGFNNPKTTAEIFLPETISGILTLFKGGGDTI